MNWKNALKRMSKAERTAARAAGRQVHSNTTSSMQRGGRRTTRSSGRGGGPPTNTPAPPPSQPAPPVPSIPSDTAEDTSANANLQDSMEEPGALGAGGPARRGPRGQGAHGDRRRSALAPASLSIVEEQEDEEGDEEYVDEASGGGTGVPDAFSDVEDDPWRDLLPTIHVDFDIPFRGAIKTLFVPSDRSLTGFLGELGSLWGSSNITFAYRVSTTEKKTKKSNAIPFRLVQNSKDWENLWNEIRRATDEAKKKDERARTTAIKANKPRPTPTRVHVEVEDRTEKEDFGEVEEITASGSAQVARKSKGKASAKSGAGETAPGGSTSADGLPPRTGKNWKKDVKGTGKFDCVEHPDDICIVRNAGPFVGQHYKLNLMDESLWWDLLDDGKATIYSIPDAILSRINDSTQLPPSGQMPSSAKRTSTAPPAPPAPQQPIVIFQQPTHYPYPGYHSTSFGPNPPGPDILASPVVARNGSFIDYPPITAWLALLDSDHRGRDGENWSQFSGAFAAAGYRRINQLVPSAVVPLTGDTLAQRVGNGLTPAGADQLISYASKDVQQIRMEAAKTAGPSTGPGQLFPYPAARF